MTHSKYRRVVNKPAKAYFRTRFLNWYAQQHGESCVKYKWKLFTNTSISVLSGSLLKLDRSNNNTHFFLWRSCIPLEPVNTALIAAGRIVIAPAHHQLTLQEDWWVSSNKWKCIKAKPTDTSVWWIVRRIGRIFETPREKYKSNRLVVLNRNTITLSLCNMLQVQI